MACPTPVAGAGRSAQVDGGRRGHREQHAEVADVAVYEHEHRRDQADRHGHPPRDSGQGHAGIVTEVPSEPALTPELAIAYLEELSTDIRAATVIDESGATVAQSGFDEGAGDVGDVVRDLFDRADDASDGAPPAQVEVSLPEGIVYAVRERGWTLAVVAGRFALSSLMFYDLRMVICDLAGEGVARP